MSKNKKGWIIGLTSAALVAVAFGGGMLTHSSVSDKIYTEAEYQQHGEQQKEEGFENGYNETQEIIADLTEIVDLLAGGVRVNATYGNIEFISSRNESVEGLWTHNMETGEYKKIVSNGTSFRCMDRNNDNTLVLITGDTGSTTQGGYVYNLETGQIVMFSETGQWQISPFSDGNVDFIILPSSATDNEELKGEGIYYFHSDEMRAEQIISTGKNWYEVGIYENEENHLLYYFSSYSSDELGLYAYDLTSMELITVASDGYYYSSSFFQTLGDKQVIACSLGFVEINDNGTLNVIIENENGYPNVDYYIYSNNMVMDTYNNLYRYNSETELVKKINFGVSPSSSYASLIPVGSGECFIFNNNENKIIVYSYSADKVFSLETEVSYNVMGLYDYNFGDEGNNIKFSGLPVGEFGSGRIYYVDFDAGTIEEVVE